MFTRELKTKKMCAKIIDINESNLNEYGLFCKKSQKKEIGYQNKIKWIRERFKEGLKYKLLIVKEGEKVTSRGFIEYIPGEYNWRGIQADGWMVIHCIWVIGQHKNKGYASKLLEECLKDAAKTNMYGVVAMTSEKGGWLASKKLFIKNEFEQIDELEPNYGLYIKKITSNPPKPRFVIISDNKLKDNKNDLTMIYTQQCPYFPGLVNDLKELAAKNNVNFKSTLLEELDDVRKNCFHPYGTFCLIYGGHVIPYQSGLKKKLVKLMEQIK